jgi:lysophospholipase L1-like esterase
MKRIGTLASWLAEKLGLSAAALGLLLSAGVFGADSGSDNRPIDWDRAKALHQREVSGDRLSAEDQAYLDRAKAAIQSGQGPGQQAGAQTRPAGAAGIDMQRARELYQKSQRGETLTPDEQAYLDKAKAAREAAGTQTRPAGDASFAGIDRQRARELFQKSQRGETLTADEQAYLDKVRTLVQRQQGRGGQQAQGTGPMSGKPAITGQESIGLVPLTQLTGDQKYKGQDGGLYGGGSNLPPESQLKAAQDASAKVVLLDAGGKPAADGKAVLMSIGMSNTTMEFSKFKEMADASSEKSAALTIVDSAQGGKDAAAWANIGATGTNPVWDEADRRLRAAGVTPQQVEVVWIKQALMGPARLGEFPAHANVLQKDIETILTLAKSRYPNLRLAYLSNRIYAGYAVTLLNPEPYSYESAFADRGVILDQIKGNPNLNADPAKGEVKAPVVLWGPYLWADGVKGRSGDDLAYKREDLGPDGTHPSPSGRQKVADLLLKFFKSDSTATPWFTKLGGSEGIVNKLQAAVPANPHADTAWSRDDAAHLLRRAGFGGTPTQIDRLQAIGRDAAVDYLLTGNLPAGMTAPFDHADLPELTADLTGDYRIQGPMLQYKLQELRAWWLDRMVRTDRPLEEKMTLFWHGLFCSGIREVRSVEAMGEQNELFHREAIGNYKRLAADIIHDPAMIKYLNNDENMKGRPNENLAREFMELFTMGEGNGYTEKDIPEVARALTGVTTDRFGETSLFMPFRHDDGPKTIFGKTGNYTPDDVPELIFARPEPATYLAKRLWQFFGTPEPTDQDIAPVAEALQNGEWELAPALRALFTSPAFYSDRCKFAVIKSPVELEAMTLRLLEEPTQPRMLFAASFTLRGMGEELFQPPNVKGWPGEEHWITSETLNTRNQIAMAASTGRLGAGVGAGTRGFGAGARRPRVAPGTQPAAGAQAARLARPTRLAQANPTTPAGSGKADPAVTAAQARQQRLQELRQEQAEQVQQALSEMPPMPPRETLVAPAKLFAELGKEATPEQVVDAAAARFLQQPLPAEKKTALIESMGTQPVTLGQAASDERVRQMIGLMMSTSEYQVE